MKAYLNLLQDVLNNGVLSNDRTGVGTRRVFGRQLRVPLNPFPILTTKKIHFRSVYFELMWMLLGRTDVGWLNDRGVRIWDEWQKEDGTLGPVYGQQWRFWADPHRAMIVTTENGAEVTHGTIDQIRDLLNNLKANPDGRRHVVLAWNPADTELMKLPPCHMAFQVCVINNTLSLMMTQRSADVFLGVPFNIASYALLAHLLCWCTGYEPGDLIVNFGDLHLYNNHVDQAMLQLTRQELARQNIVRPLTPADRMEGQMPSLDIFLDRLDFSTSPDYDPQADMLPWYNSHPAIKADVAV